MDEREAVARLKMSDRQPEHRLAAILRPRPATSLLGLAVVLVAALLMLALATRAPGPGSPLPAPPAGPSVPPGRSNPGLECPATSWQSGPADRSDLLDLPWIKAAPESSGIRAYFWFGDQRAGERGRLTSGVRSKVLWRFAHGAAQPLLVRGYPGGGATAAFTQAVEPASSPWGDYPAILTIPAPGCWRIDLARGAVTGTLTLQVAAAGAATVTPLLPAPAPVVSTPMPSPTPGGAGWALLRARPLALPALPPQAACPAARGQTVNPAFGLALGSGPLYPVGLGSPGLLQYISGGDNFPGRWGGQKVLWVGAPAYRGPALVRGHQIDGPNELRFGLGANPAAELLLDAAQADSLPGSWNNWPSYTRIRAAGCYAYQVDGVTFSTVVIFQAIPATQ